jgi:hypothetical protein
MKNKLALSLGIIPLLLTACATERPPQAFHPTDSAALVVESLDGGTARMIQPTPGNASASADILNQLKDLPQHSTAVIILENYTEPKLGAQFRDRSFGWFIGLRGLGYQHILFLQGNGTGNPDGLPTLAEYH